MLIKKPGNYNAERLRTILLLAADYNHNNKRAGRDMMKIFKAHKNIPENSMAAAKIMFPWIIMSTKL